jgi:hypothetical protein
MGRLVEPNLQPEGLKELAEDVVRSGREQALSNRKFVEKIKGLGPGLEALGRRMLDVRSAPTKTTRPSNPSSRSVAAAAPPARLAPTITKVCLLTPGP